jgi:SAM-dependent methyltransferase
MTEIIVGCRSCAFAELLSVLSLGQTPLANALLTKEQLSDPEPTYPLDLVYCPRCTLVQITETVPPQQLFAEYLYLSSFSDTIVSYAKENVTRLINSRGLDKNSFIIEIASNDGYLLQFYKKAGISVLGIEPATNIARVARTERGIPTLAEFFGIGLAQRLRSEGKLADVIHANNVLAHVADLNGVVSGLALLLKDTGVAVLEVPYVKDLIDHSEFDTIYHEHLCYFSLTALQHLFNRHGLQIYDVERLTLQGGSLRVFARKPRSPEVDPADAVASLLAEENDWGVNNVCYYLGFANKVEKLRDALVRLLLDLKAQGKRVAVYGASAKGSTLLNYCGLGRSVFDFIVDRSTVKQGLYAPGTHIPIHEPKKLLTEQPDYVLLLTWNLSQEILAQQSEYRRRGGRFIIPIPQVRVIEADESLQTDTIGANPGQ